VLLVGDTGAVIDDRDVDLTASHRGAYLDRTVTPVLDGVVHEVREHPGKVVGVSDHGRDHIAGFEQDSVAVGKGFEKAVEQRLEFDRARTHRERVGLDPRDHQKILDERLEPVRLLCRHLDELAGSGVLRGEFWPLERSQGADDRRQRCAKLV